MDPRKHVIGRNKSTSIPTELLDQVRDVFQKGFKKELKDLELFVEGRIFPAELILSLGFIPKGNELKQINFEASIDHDGAKIFEKVHQCVDAISSMLEHYFSDPDAADFPKYWQPFDFQGGKIYLQVTGRNSRLEEEANKLLGEESESALYSGSEADGDADDAEHDDEDTSH